MLESFIEAVKVTFGLVLLVVGAVFIFPGVVVTWAFTPNGFWGSWGAALGNPAAWVGCGIFWGVVFAVLRDAVFAGFSAAVAIIGGVIWYAEPNRRVSDAELLHHTPVSVSVRGFLSRDGRSALFGEFGGTVRVYDVGSWSETRHWQVRGCDRQHVNTADFSPDGRSVVIGTGRSGYGPDEPDGGYVVIHDFESAEDRVLARGQFGDARAVRFSEDGRRVVAAGYWDTVFGVFTFDAETGTKVESLLWGRRNVRSLVLSPDGRRLLLMEGENTDRQSVWLWDLERQKTPSKLRLSLGEYDYQGIAFHPDGTQIIVFTHFASETFAARVWNPVSAGETEFTSGDADRRYIVVGRTVPNTSVLLDLQTGKLLRVIDPVKPDTEITDLAISYDGRHLLSRSLYSVALWRLR